MNKHGTSECFDAGCRCQPCYSAHMSAIAKSSVKARIKKYGKKGFAKRLAKAAAMSHPVNNPNAQRGEYTGGRPPKVKTDVAVKP